MVLAIISFAFEFIFIAAGPVMMSNMSQGFAIFVVVMFCLCTFTSIIQNLICKRVIRNQVPIEQKRRFGLKIR